jgi:hypothetical protein
MGEAVTPRCQAQAGSSMVLVPFENAAHSPVLGVLADSRTSPPSGATVPLRAHHDIEREPDRAEAAAPTVR